MHVCHTKSVSYFEFLQHSGAGAWFLSILHYRAIYHFSLQTHICTWQWARFTFLTCWSKCSECSSLLLWPRQSRVVFLDVYNFFPNALSFSVVACLLFYSETMICVQADYCLFLNMPPWDFSFFFNCKFPMKSITCVPFSSIRIPYCASSLTLPSMDHHQGFALLFALGFTYCRS